MADKIIQAMVTHPTFINNVLHMPGEVANVNLTELGIAKLGEGSVEVTDSDGKTRNVKADLTPGLEAFNVRDGELLEQAEVAAVSPHAPNPTAPQGIPPGTVQSGTGRLLSPASPESDELAREMVAPEPVAPPTKK